MQKKLVFVPVGLTDVELIAAGEPLLNRPAFTVTAELMDSLGYDSELIEDAEYAVMVIASVLGLSVHGERIVLVAELDENRTIDVVDAENGQFTLPRLDLGSLVAFFCDDPSTDCSSAAKASVGLDIDRAWETEEVQFLLNNSDLLWHGVGELKALIGS